MKLNNKLTGKALLSLLASMLVGLVIGVLISNFARHDQSPGDKTDSSRKTAREVLYWVAPMDASFRRAEPGKSPMGMDLIPVYADAAANGDAIHVSAAVEQSLGVRTSKAERRSLWRKVEATGYVDFDESRVSQINLRTEGWIERLLVTNEGERVTKGQLLFEFYSPQLVNAQKE